jgi:hypothetical protein
LKKQGCPAAEIQMEALEEDLLKYSNEIRGNRSANLIMQGLQAETGEIRKRMTEKYQVEF